MSKLSKALTWDDLADAYNKAHSGRSAFTLPMDIVFSWAKAQKKKYKVKKKKGTIHKILSK